MTKDEIVIKSKSDFKLLDIKELWRYRELLYIFTWRNLKIRYKQTMLGILWVLLQPLLSTFIFTVFFGNILKIKSGGIPYPLFVLTGLVYWTFFSNALSQSSMSLITNAGILQKIYFPRIIIPLSMVLTSFIDFLIAFIMLLIFALFLGYIPNIWFFLVFPLTIFVSVITASGLGFFLSSINIKYRDVTYIVPYFIQIMLFVTPIIYPFSIVGERNRFLMSLNPMSSVIEFSRFMFFDKYFIVPSLSILSVIISIIIFISGLWYFNKTEKYFADVV
ncbi:phosphate ABC transporter permease [Candidatus Gottesmanbacteria bacterium RBG_13_37_7]|uniref:Transport permease protein n=1 Tax=Candidatus Gottesmanbacteria bacterium RBG_13_37_7 TaxID=1798369 RepID=A0A1F5YH71_9BACT|nr:MAG: phosphate ABC transporter permease [Candidatus Gottesmanbacteria bacterium RBG_13_37_7]